jgi:hypothetical protein
VVGFLSPTLLLLANASVSGGVRMEVQAGEAPTIADPNPSYFVAALVQPDITLRLLTPATETRVSEAPRLLLRRPNVANRSRPLYLNTLQAEHRGHRGQRLNWNLQLTSIAGEVDYGALSQVLGKQAALPDTLDLLTVDGSAWVGWRLTRRMELSAETGVLRRQPLGGSSADASPSLGLTLPTETDERLAPRLDYAISSRQAARLRVQMTNYRMTGAVRLWAMAAELRLTWSYKLTRNHELQLALGGTVAKLEERSDPPRPWSSLCPLAGIALLTSKPLSQVAMLRSRASGEVAWYLDPVLGVSLPRAQVNAEVALEIGPAWLLALNLMAATNVSRQPLVGSPIETVVSAVAPLRYRVGRHWLAELGGRYSERGPHLATPAFSLGQRELLGYLAMTAMTK